MRELTEPVNLSNPRIIEPQTKLIYASIVVMIAFIVTAISLIYMYEDPVISEILVVILMALIASFVFMLFIYYRSCGHFGLEKEKEPVSSRDDKKFIGIYTILWLTLGLSVILVIALVCLEEVLTLPFAVVFSIVATVITLTIAATVFSQLKLTSEEEALGLPKGTIRAVIALSLIVIFAILIIFMQNQLAPYWQEFPSNATIVYPNGTAITYPNGTAILQEPSQAQRDFSLQTLTTISTLVVAIVGFYFGTRSVAQAQQATPQVSITFDPKSPYTLKDDEDKKEITVTAKPGNEIIKAEIRDDDGNKGSIRKLSDNNKFMYTAPARGDKEITVAIDFYLLKYPGDIEPWLITIPKQPPKS